MMMNVRNAGITYEECVVYTCHKYCQWTQKFLFSSDYWPPFTCFW